MSDEDALEARYQASYGRQAGFLPADRAALRPFLHRLRASAARAIGIEPVSPGVRDFAAILAREPVLRMYAARMIHEVAPEHRTVDSIAELLAQLDVITRTAPQWHDDPAQRHFFPMSSLFCYMMMTPSGEAAFRDPAFNDGLRAVLRDWCAYLDGPESRWVINRVNGWLSPLAWRTFELDQFVIPDPADPNGGFASYNAFFHRAIRPEARPLAGPGDPSVVVAPNDGAVYRVARGAAARASFWLKAQPYSLADMLRGQWLDRFVGGDVLQSYLSGADYHRFHAPVSGRVTAAQIVAGLMFSNLESEGDDIKGTGSQGYYTAVNTRGLLAIEADHPGLGLVVVMPIGITEVSSVQFCVAEGDRVQKGDEVGRFSYGGSSLAVLFQRGAVADFSVAEGDAVRCRGALATASGA
jgi:phosphatidylserine decarboxylase